MFLLEKIKNFQKEFSIKNPYFSIQFLFIWALFRILAFLGTPFLIRLGFCLFLMMSLLYFWEFIIPRILNNLLFQYYLFIFYRIINFCLFFEYSSFYLGQGQGQG